MFKAVSIKSGIIIIAFLALLALSGPADVQTLFIADLYLRFLKYSAVLLFWYVGALSLLGSEFALRVCSLLRGGMVVCGSLGLALLFLFLEVNQVDAFCLLVSFALVPAFLQQKCLSRPVVARRLQVQSFFYFNFSPCLRLALSQGFVAALVSKLAVSLQVLSTSRLITTQPEVLTLISLYFLWGVFSRA